MVQDADTTWDDEEIVLTDMSPDTEFVFDRMTQDFVDAVAVVPGEEVLDVACGRGIDATHLWKRGAKAYGIEPSATMIDKALSWMGIDGPIPVTMVRSLAEDLPFADHSFDKVVCKGAIDHFVDLDRTFEELVRVTKPDGRVVIGVANFESLSCIVGRNLDKTREAITGKAKDGYPFWKPPEDHNHKFDYEFLHESMGKFCRIESLTGVSMLWGMPYWGKLMSRLPESWSTAVLEFLHSRARTRPRLSDVLIAVGIPRK